MIPVAQKLVSLLNLGIEFKIIKIFVWLFNIRLTNFDIQCFCILKGFCTWSQIWTQFLYLVHNAVWLVVFNIPGDKFCPNHKLTRPKKDNQPKLLYTEKVLLGSRESSHLESEVGVRTVSSILRKSPKNSPS